MTTTPKLIIFTDLDGTLLDPKTYSFEPAEPALDLMQEEGIPLILSSSKTRTEIEFYRKQLENGHPFISENGGGIFIPKGYFPFPFFYDRELNDYFVLELGTSYTQIIEVFSSIKNETGIAIRGFSDLSEEELISLCGLILKEAEFAKKREYDEPFIIEGDEEEVEVVKTKIEKKGMNYTWVGKFHHILGKNDKGKAVEILKKLYKNRFSSILTIGIGDNLNDLPMLMAVDHPILLKDEKAPLSEAKAPIQNLTVVSGMGPQGWNNAILRKLNELEN